jgi:hypothetical protein
MDAARLQFIVRTILGLMAAGSMPALRSAGYESGAETTVGLDAGIVRDAVAGGLALAAVFFPQILTVWSMITNTPRIQALEKRVDKLDGGSNPANPAELRFNPAPAPTSKPVAKPES